MGLDMYLAVESTMAKEDLVTFLEKEDLARYWNWGGQERRLETLGNYDDGAEDADAYPVIAYWRKANAIHAWIVRNKAGGVDECQRIPMTRASLTELLDTCLSVLDAGKTDEALEYAAAEFGLEPQAGFFFGSTEIDEWYRRDLEDTCQQLEKILNVKSWPDNVAFFYRASW